MNHYPPPEFVKVTNPQWHRWVERYAISVCPSWHREHDDSRCCDRCLREARKIARARRAAVPVR